MNRFLLPYFFIILFCSITLSGADPEEYSKEYEAFRTALGSQIPAFSAAEKNLQQIEEWWDDDQEGKREFKKGIVRALGAPEESDPIVFMKDFLNKQQQILQTIKASVGEPATSFTKKTATLRRVPKPASIVPVQPPVVPKPPVDAQKQPRIIKRVKQERIAPDQPVIAIEAEQPVQIVLSSTSLAIPQFVELAQQVIKEIKTAYDLKKNKDLSAALGSLFDADKSLQILMHSYAFDELNKEKIAAIEKEMMEKKLLKLPKTPTIEHFLKKIREDIENERYAIEKSMEKVIVGGVKPENLERSEQKINKLREEKKSIIAETNTLAKALQRLKAEHLAEYNQLNIGKNAERIIVSAVEALKE